MSKIFAVLECWKKSRSPAEIVAKFQDIGDPREVRAAIAGTSEEEQRQAYEDLAQLMLALESWKGSLMQDKEQLLALLDTSERTASACIAYKKISLAAKEEGK